MNQIMNTTSKQIPQMSSLDIVDFINDYRAKNHSNQTQLRHADFMAKVPKVIGELSENYRSVYRDIIKTLFFNSMAVLTFHQKL